MKQKKVYTYKMDEGEYKLLQQYAISQGLPSRGYLIPLLMRDKKIEKLIKDYRNQK